MKTEDIAYLDGSLSCNGYLAYNEAGRGKRPGILVIHEAWGLGNHAMERARMLADLGYVAFAADMFGGRQQATMKTMQTVMGDLRENTEKRRARARAALARLAARPEVDSARLGAIGFCFGGSTVLELARGGTDLKGVVSFHGSLETPTPAQKGAVKAAVLACHGADDPFVPAAQVAAFQEEMSKAGADWQFISYGNTVHSFTNPEADGSVKGIAYDARTDRRSWAAMRTFFEEVLA